MAATFGQPAAEETAGVLINGVTVRSIAGLSSAVSAEIRMPVGWMRKVALAILRRQQGCIPPGDGAAGSRGAEEDSPTLDIPLSWCPLAANGRLRPSLDGQAAEQP